MAGRPLRPATDHRLGEPLPHQLANRPQAPPKASLQALSSASPPPTRAHAELPPVSEGYPPPRGRLPTCSSPVRHVSSPKAAPFDLHALGTPPALILSQDQTLHHDLCAPHSPVRSRPKTRSPRKPRSFVCVLSCERSPDPPDRPKAPGPDQQAPLRLPRTPTPPGLVAHCLCNWRIVSMHTNLRSKLTQAANLLGNRSFEAPTAVAWNSTAVNRCSGLGPSP